jgi:Sulfotransferase family
MRFAPAVVVLGVSRSGTTLLRHMLDRHSELAIPGESYFIHGLWDRYRRRPDPSALLADLSCLARLREWEVDLETVRRRLPPGADFAEVLQSVYAGYAEARGKRRFGDRTPLYMLYLDALEQAFPRAQYVHIIRDARDAALSFRAMRAPPRGSWAWPHGLYDFAEQWRLEVTGARHFGATVAAGRYLELRYEDLVAAPEPKLREVCDFLGFEFEPAMLEFHRDVQPGQFRNHARLREPASPGSRNWRKEMSAAQLRRFEAIAGGLLSELGYQRACAAPSARTRWLAALDRGSCRLRLGIGRRFAWLARRTPLWRLRHRFELWRGGFPVNAPRPCLDRRVTAGEPRGP